MSEKTTSQSQQTQQTKTVEDSMGKMESFFREIQKLEAQNIEAANRAIDESARLWKESIAYSVKLTNEWRALALKTTKQAADMMSVGFPT